MKKLQQLKPGRHRWHSWRRAFNKKRPLMSAALIAIMLASVIGLARWPPKWMPPRIAAVLQTRQNPTGLPPPPSSPSKEYIYVGDKLVAIEERASVSPGPVGPPPSNLIATVTYDSRITLNWTAPPTTTGSATDSVSHYEVERSQSANGPYITLSPNPTSASFIDTPPSTERVTAYLYRVRAVYTAGRSEPSNTDLATNIIFADDPLNPNPAEKTIIKAQHLVELRRAVNAVRVLAGMGEASWTHPDSDSGSSQQRRIIYLEDIQELRTKIDEALGVLGRLQPYVTDPTLTRYGIIKKDHFQELRERVK